MRKTNTQLKLLAKSIAPATKLTDASGNPSESYNWRHMSAVRRAWQQEYWRPSLNSLDLSVAEIMSIEAQVRRELYS
jgi:hypothetical protein